MSIFLDMDLGQLEHANLSRRKEMTVLQHGNGIDVDNDVHVPGNFEPRGDDFAQVGPSFCLDKNLNAPQSANAGQRGWGWPQNVDNEFPCRFSQCVDNFGGDHIRGSLMGRLNS